MSTQDSELTKYSDYYRFIRRFSVENALIVINRVSVKIFSQDDSDPFIKRYVPRVVNPWQLAFLTKSLILHSNDFRREEIDTKALLQCANLYNDLEDPFTSKAEKTELDFYSFMLRTAHQQFPAQLAVRYHLGRTRYLFVELAAADTATLDVGAEFRRITGMSVMEFMTVGFGFFASTMEHVAIRLPLTTQVEHLRPFFSERNVNSFLEMCMATYDRFRDQQRAHPSKEGYDKFEFNCLKAFPLIQTERKKLCLAPDPALLIQRITRGIYYDLLDAFNEGGKINRFATFFGKNIFEPYVGRLLKEAMPSGLVFPEVEYGGNRTADWIVVEGDAAVFIECKSSDLTAQVKSFAEEEKLLDDLRKRVAKGILTCHRTQEDILQQKRGLESFNGIKRFHFLVVTFDDSFLADTPVYRHLMDSELSGKIASVPKYHVSSIGDFEFFIDYAGREGLARLLEEKEADAERYLWDFREFVLKRHATDLDKDTPLINRFLETQAKGFYEGVLGRQAPADL